MRSRSLLVLSAFFLVTALPPPAKAQTYYYVEPYPGEAASISPTNVTCDSTVIGAIRYNAGTAAFEGCNGTAWSNFATAAGSTGQVQFNSGGMLGANANFFWDNVNGRLGIGTATPGTVLEVNGVTRLDGSISGYTALQSYAAPTASVTYTLPAAGPTTTGYVLSSDTSGNMSWAVNGAGATLNGINAATGSQAGILNGANTIVWNWALAGTGSTAFTFGESTAATTGGRILNVATASASTAVPLTITNAGASTIAMNITAGGVAFNGTSVLTYPHSSADTTSWADGPNTLTVETGNTEANTALGPNAGQYVSSGANNTALGALAMQGVSGVPLTGGSNTAVGYQALLLAQGTATKNTAMGYAAGAAVTTGTDNTLLGYTAGNLINSGTGNLNIIVGEGGNITTGSSNILIGNSLTGTTAATSNQLDIGDLIIGATSTKKVGINDLTLLAGYDLGFSGQAARTVGMEREVTAATAGNTLTINAGGATSLGTDKAGGNLILTSGISTGMGASDVIIQTSLPSLLSINSDDTLTEAARFKGTGHMEFHGTAPTVAVAGCGTTGSTTVAGNDNAFSVITGTTAVTTCAITFFRAWTNSPICNVTAGTAGALPYISAQATTGITITFTSSASQKFYIRCSGWN